MLRTGAADRMKRRLAVALLLLVGGALGASGVSAQSIRVIGGPTPTPVAWLGIRFFIAAGDFTPQVVDAVPEGGPAALVGVVAGDTIIRVDGSRRVVDRLQGMRLRLRPGDTVHLRLRNHGEEREVWVRADHRPDDPAYAPRLVVQMSAIDSSLSRRMDSMLSLVTARARVTYRAIPTVDPTSSDRPRGVTTIFRFETRPDALQGILRGQVRASVSPRGFILLDSVRTGFRGELGLSFDSLAVRGRSSFMIGDGLRTPLIETQNGGIRVVLGAPGRFLGGAGVETLSAELGSYFGVREGVLVLNVREGTPASEAGLHGGDIVVKVDATPIRSTEELEEALRIPEARTLEIVRDGSLIRIRIPR